MATKKTDAGAAEVDDYIATFPENVRTILTKVRETIRKAAPEATEAIRYQIPTFIQNGNLVHFAAFKSHIGFYPGPTGIEQFSEELSKYEGAKGSVRFPLGQPVPYALIAKVVRFRVKENVARPSKKRP